MTILPYPKITHNRAQLLAFLSTLMEGPSPCVEFRIFNAEVNRYGFIGPSDYSRTLSGWYDDANALAVDAAKLQGVSGYVTFNPVDPRLLARSANKLTKCQKGQGTHDSDIITIRWVYLDIDPVRPAGISSTDSELKAALDVRDAILDFPGIRSASLWGCSGNGAFILSKIHDRPNDAATRRDVQNGLVAMSHAYNTPAVKIDVSTYNAARVMCLPGTMKCKGSNTADRPWRMVTLDGHGDK